MKQEILLALKYPRTLVRGDLDLDDCRHSGNYAQFDQKCMHCFQGDECEWLYAHEVYLEMDGKPLDELEAALAFALGYVDARITHWGHRSRTCRCEACVWLRETRRLYDRVVTRVP